MAQGTEQKLQGKESTKPSSIKILLSVTLAGGIQFGLSVTAIAGIIAGVSGLFHLDRDPTPLIFIIKLGGVAFIVGAVIGFFNAVKVLMRR